MTEAEAEWRKCHSWNVLLGFYVPARTRERKVRQFACACCREAWDLLAAAGRNAVEAAERYADGEIGEAELGRAQAGARRAHRSAVGAVRGQAAFAAWLSVQKRVDGTVPPNCIHRAFLDGSKETPRSRELGNRLTALYHDLTGNPFRPVTFLPEWRTSTAVALASQLYASRDFSAMPILADALQDAGCDSDDILNHCRGDGPHVRGCWVVDLVLGKE